MATAPTLADYQQSTWSDTSALSEVTALITFLAGDVIVVVGMTDTNTATLSTPTAVGLTFSQIATPTNSANECKAYAWAATAAADGSSVITCTVNAATNSRGLSAFVYRGSDGTGATAISAALGATTTQSLVRGSANSAVVTCWGDFNAVNDTTVTWTPSGQTQRVAQFVSGQATFFVANWGDQGAAGTTSYGFSGFAGGEMAAVTVEIKGAAGGGGVTYPQLERGHRGQFRGSLHHREVDKAGREIMRQYLGQFKRAA